MQRNEKLYVLWGTDVTNKFDTSFFFVFSRDVKFDHKKNP